MATIWHVRSLTAHVIYSWSSAFERRQRLPQTVFFCGCADEGAFPVSMILYDISALNSDVWFQLVSLLVSLFNDQWSIVLFFIEFVDWIHFFQPNDELYITENVELPSYFSFIIKKKHKKVSALSFFNRKKTAEKFAIKITQKKKKRKKVPRVPMMAPPSMSRNRRAATRQSPGPALPAMNLFCCFLLLVSPIKSKAYSCFLTFLPSPASR